MLASSEYFRLSKTLRFDEISWPKVHSLLTRRFKLAEAQADMLIRNFIERFTRPLNLSWFCNRPLSDSDNTLLAAVCEWIGADSVTVIWENQLSVGAFRCDYRQAIDFRPLFKQRAESESRSHALAKIELSLLGGKFAIESLRQAIFLSAMLFALAVIFYVLVAGILLYGISVFIVFIREPMTVTWAATRNAPLGLALLSFSVGIAAICGRCIRDLMRRFVIWRSVFRPENTLGVSLLRSRKSR